MGMNQVRFAQDRRSGVRTRAIREVGYIGRDRAFATLLRERGEEHGIAVRIPDDRLGTQTLLDSRRIKVLVIDASGRDLVPPQLLEEIRRSTSHSLQDQERIVVSRHPRGANVVCFSRDEHEQTLMRVVRAVSQDSDVVPLEDILLGNSAAMAAVRNHIHDIATFAEVNVLVLGETGTGKELVAQAIHQLGAAADKPFVGVNCAAIPESLFESELFGHAQGTFTGAGGARAGLFEEAGRGTVFLDEVGEMPESLQPKLLRALDTRSFRRIGSNREQPFQARIVSATNREAHQLAGLRQDLFYRLAGFTIQLPPLRQRVEDVGLLAEAFASTFAESHVLPVPTLSADALDALRTHTWPGNVRELKVVMQHAVIVARGGLIDRRMIERSLHTPMPVRMGQRAPSRPPASSISVPTPIHGVGQGRSLRDIERELILRALDKHQGNVARTARHLGIPRSTLRARLRRYEDGAA